MTSAKTPPPRVQAPFTRDQVWSLNAYQDSHITQAGAPYECETPTHQVLVAGQSGWFCLDCGYRRNWAWLRHADWSWKRSRQP